VDQKDVGAFDIPTHVCDERLATSILDCLDDFADKHRMHRRVANVVAGVHLDDDGFILHAVANAELVEDQIQFGGKGFLCLISFESRPAMTKTYLFKQ
jgi:hypothetical protein